MDMGKKFASILATAAVLSAFGAHAADLEAVASAPSSHSVEITSVVRDEIGLRCDTCVNAEALYAEAQSRFGTAVDTKVYAVNAATGTIVGVFINYLGPRNRLPFAALRSIRCSNAGSLRLVKSIEPMATRLGCAWLHVPTVRCTGCVPMEPSRS